MGYSFDSMLRSYEIAFDSNFRCARGASFWISDVARMMMVAQAAHCLPVMIASVHSHVEKEWRRRK